MLRLMESRPSAPPLDPPRYALSDDLARLCLPQEYREAHRRLAWANSICALFLVIGLTGLRPVPLKIRELVAEPDLVPVIVQQPEEEEPPKPTAETPPEEPPDPLDIITDQPVVATVVAADASTVAFAVPVQGPVILAPARFAAPPPSDLQARPGPASAPTRFVPSNEDWGGRRQPEYPGLAVRRGYQGKVTLEVVFAADGALTEAQVRTSSGYKVLDDAALEHVQQHLRLRNPPGEVRRHLLDIIFQLR